MTVLVTSGCWLRAWVRGFDAGGPMLLSPHARNLQVANGCFLWCVCLWCVFLVRILWLLMHAADQLRLLCQKPRHSVSAAVDQL